MVDDGESAGGDLGWRRDGDGENEDVALIRRWMPVSSALITILSMRNKSGFFSFRPLPI